MESYPLIVLIHHAVCIVLAIYALKYTILIIFYHRLTKKCIQISPVLYFYFMFIIIWAVVSLANRIYSLVFWRPSGNEYNARTLYWLRLTVFILEFVGIAVEICMCIDRCVTIKFGEKYTPKMHEFFCYTSLIGLFLFVVGFLSVNDFLDIIPSSSKTKCITFSCFQWNLKSNNLIATKFAIAGLNVTGGIVLRRLSKHRFINSTKTKKICNAILAMIIFSTIFEVLPACLTQVVYRQQGYYLNNVIGPYDSTLISMNITICSYVYSNGFLKAFKIIASDDDDTDNGLDAIPADTATTNV